MFYNVELIDVDSGEILRYDMVHVNTFNDFVQYRLCFGNLETNF